MTSSSISRVFKRGAPSFGVAFLMAAAGVAQAAANVMMAHMLSPRDFGVISAIQVLAFFGGNVSPLGRDQALPRLIGPDRGAAEIPWKYVGGHTLRQAVLPISMLIGAASIFFVWSEPVALIVMSPFVVALLAFGVGASRVSANILRVAKSTVSGQLVLNLPRYLLFIFVAGIYLTGIGTTRLEVPLFAFAAIGVLSFFFYRLSLRAIPFVSDPGDHQDAIRGLRAESKYFLWTALTLVGLSYVDRLSIAAILGPVDLGTYAAVWWIVFTPFSLLQNSIGFVLLPLLRGCTSRKQIRQNLLIFGVAGGVLLVFGGALIVSLFEPVFHYLYQGKFVADNVLVIWLTGCGSLVVIYSLPSSLVGAWGGNAELAGLARFGWFALVAGIGLSVAGAYEYGLRGVAVAMFVALFIRASGASLIGFGILRGVGSAIPFAK